MNNSKYEYGKNVISRLIVKQYNDIVKKIVNVDVLIAVILLFGGIILLLKSNLMWVSLFFIISALFISILNLFFLLNANRINIENCFGYVKKIDIQEKCDKDSSISVNLTDVEGGLYWKLLYDDIGIEHILYDPLFVFDKYRVYVCVRGIKVIVGASSHYDGAVRISKLLYEFISEKDLRDTDKTDTESHNN